MKKYSISAAFLAMFAFGLLNAQSAEFDYSAHPGGKLIKVDLDAILLQVKEVLLGKDFQKDFADFNKEFQNKFANLVKKYASKITLNQEQYKDLKEILGIFQGFANLNWYKVDVEEGEYRHLRSEALNQFRNTLESLDEEAREKITTPEIKDAERKISSGIKRGSEFAKFEKLKGQLEEKVGGVGNFERAILQVIQDIIQVHSEGELGQVGLSFIFDLLNPSLKSAEKVIDKKIKKK